MAINIHSEEQFVIRLTGAHLAAICQGLGELAHKIAGPVEQHLHAEVLRCKELNENKATAPIPPSLDAQAAAAKVPVPAWPLEAQR